MSVNEEALLLKPLDKIRLIDELLLSLDIPNKELEQVWIEESERRIKAYDTGKIKATDLYEVLSKYQV